MVPKLHDYLLTVDQERQAIELAATIKTPEDVAKAARTLIHFRDALGHCAESYLELAKKVRETRLPLVVQQERRTSSD